MSLLQGEIPFKIVYLLLLFSESLEAVTEKVNIGSEKKTAEYLSTV